MSELAPAAVKPDSSSDPLDLQKGIPDTDLLSFFEAVIAQDLPTMVQLCKKYDVEVNISVVMPSASDPSSEMNLNVRTLSPQHYAATVMGDLEKFKQCGDPDKAVTKSGFFKDYATKKQKKFVVSHYVHCSCF